MKTIFYFIIGIMFVVVPTTVQAQSGTVSVKLNQANLRGQKLNFDLDVRINHIYVGRYESLSLTLVLQKGRESLRLPPIIINGTNKRKMYERTVALRGLEEAMGDAYAVLKNDENLIQFVPYKEAVFYRPWMNNCQLVLVGEILDYDNNVTQTFTDVLEKSLKISRR